MSGAEGASRRAFVFAGGGTGGHIYPALAIIERLRAIDPGVEVHILCSDRAIDQQILCRHDVPFSSIPAAPVSFRLWGMLGFIRGWRPSVAATRARIEELRKTNGSVVLVAMGGFVAAPAARAARRAGAKVVLINLDAIPGKANGLVARSADAVFTACDIEGRPDWKRVPPIIRAGSVAPIDRAEALGRFGLKPDARTLLVTGGSTGARSINRFVMAFLSDSPDALRGWQIIHQTGEQIGEDEFKELGSLYGRAGIPAWVGRYIEDMGAAYAAADLGVSRCGAGTVAECWGAGLPSIFFPYPYHKDQHQLHNAKALIETGGAVACADRVDPAGNLEEHGSTLRALLSDADRLARMRAALESLGPPDGARRVAFALLDPGASSQC